MPDPFCNFYVGQRVTLKEPASGSQRQITFHTGHTITLPEFGVVYTVRELAWDSVLQRTGIRLVELVNPPAPWMDGFGENSWWHVYFRPVTDISDLEKLLTGVPTKELEPV